MATIVSGASSDILTIDATSKAARVTLYGTDGSLTTGGSKQTFTASSAAFSTVATPTDVFAITGTASKTVKITKMWISGVQTTAGVITTLMIKRSTANSGGTSASVTAVAHDSNNSSATATVLQYTANPTTGTTVGNVWSGKHSVPAAATAGIGGFCGVLVDFVELYGQPVVLRGTSQVLAINLNSVTLTGGSIHCGVTWTEE